MPGTCLGTLTGSSCHQYPSQFRAPLSARIWGPRLGASCRFCTGKAVATEEDHSVPFRLRGPPCYLLNLICLLAQEAIVQGFLARGIIQSREGLERKELVDTELDLGRRIKEAREALNLTQAELAEQVGFASRQTVTDLEANRRHVRAAELVTLANALKTDVSSLLSGDSIVGRPQVLWRARPCERATEIQAEFLQWCERYHRILALTGKTGGDRLPSVDASLETMSFSNADSLATNVRATLDLGSRPALALQSAMESQWDVLVWYRRSHRGISRLYQGTLGSCDPHQQARGALASKLRSGSRVVPPHHDWIRLPNRFRQDPALGEEWSNSPMHSLPALLLPADSLRAELQQRGPDGEISWPNLVATAREFDVSTHALILRLVNLRIVKNDATEMLKQERFKKLDKSSMTGRWWEPTPLPERFVLLAFRPHRKASSLVRGWQSIWDAACLSCRSAWPNTEYLKTMKGSLWRTVLRTHTPAEARVTKPKYVLLDAGPIIGLHAAGVWREFLYKYEVVVPETVKQNEALFHSEDPLTGFHEPIASTRIWGHAFEWRRPTRRDGDRGALSRSARTSRGELEPRFCRDTP